MAEVSKLYFSSTGSHGSRGELVVVLTLVVLTAIVILAACFGVWLAL